MVVVRRERPLFLSCHVGAGKSSAEAQCFFLRLEFGGILFGWKHEGKFKFWCRYTHIADKMGGVYLFTITRSLLDSEDSAETRCFLKIFIPDEKPRSN